MELVSILRDLWRRKLSVLAVFVVALLVAIASAYKLPSMQPRSVELGAASSQILIDSPASTLVQGADSGQITTLSTRALVFAQYLSSLEARNDIARASGIPARAISLSGPFSNDNARVTYQPQASSERANDIAKESDVYRLLFTAQEGVPIITVTSQAPTADAAVRLARAAYVTLQRYVDKLQIQAESVPVKPLPKGVSAAPVTPDPGVKVRQLGEPVGGVIGSGNGKLLMLVAFIGVMLIGCAVITILPGMARHWRLLDKAELLLDDPESLPPVVGAGGRGDDAVRLGGRTRWANGNGGSGAPLAPDEADAGTKPRASAWR
jgi:hypothetical protein